MTKQDAGAVADAAFSKFCKHSMEFAAAYAELKKARVAPRSSERRYKKALSAAKGAAQRRDDASKEAGIALDFWKDYDRQLP